MPHSALAQKAADDNVLPKYDPNTEMKTNGIVDEIKVLAMGTRKDFTELILKSKSGDDTVQIYRLQSPTKTRWNQLHERRRNRRDGLQGEAETAEVSRAREIIKGNDTLMFRDGAGKPVWDAKTGK